MNVTHSPELKISLCRVADYLNKTAILKKIPINKIKTGDYSACYFDLLGKKRRRIPHNISTFHSHGLYLITDKSGKVTRNIVLP